MFEWKTNPFLLSPPSHLDQGGKGGGILWPGTMRCLDLIGDRWFTVSGLCLPSSLKRETFRRREAHIACVSQSVWNREDSIGRLDDAGKEEGPEGRREMLCLISEHSISWTVLSYFSKQSFLVTALQCQPASTILKPLVIGKFLPLRACKAGTKWFHYAGAL